ncbi:H/ACA ribonucleoprotein complex subunit 2 [Enteropsectra breve]|nr:H/ACA ribonucleoprotein complex subunit 2 [Enteropsectra breve]
MIPIAHPLADDNASKLILEETERVFALNSLISGIKACEKKIKKNEDAQMLMVLSGTTTPMDLITHIPIMCEEKGISYIFVPENKWIKDFSCVMLPVDNEKMTKINEQAWPKRA